MNLKWRSYFYHPLFVGFIISLVAIFTIVKFVPRYKTQIIEESTINNNGKVYYYDIDNDGNSEKIHYHNYDRIFEPTLYLYNSDESFRFLWNFQESPVKDCDVYVEDFNNDSIKEIFVFTKELDSIFLYVLNTIDDKAYFLNKKFVTYVENADCKINIIGLYDLNNSNNKKFLFSVDAVYPLSPRKIFAYDFIKDEFITSPELNVCIEEEIRVSDIDLDGKMEIIVPNKSVELIGNGCQSQLIILDQNLDYKIEPVNFHGTPSQVSVSILNIENKNYIVCLNSSTEEKQIYNNVILFDIKGNRLLEKSINSKYNQVIIDNGWRNEFLSLSENSIIIFDEDFEKVKEVDINKKCKLNISDFLDVNNNNVPEIFLQDSTHVYIVNDDLSDVVALHNLTKSDGNYTVLKSTSKNDLLSVQLQNNWYLIEIIKSEEFFHSILFYLLIFVVISVVLFGISKLISIIKNKERNSDIDFSYSELEENLNDKIYNLKNNLNEIKDELNENSYNLVLDQIDDTFNQVKDISKQFTSVKKEQESLKTKLINVVETRKDGSQVKLALFPNEEWEPINLQSENLAITLINIIFDYLDSIDKDICISLQILDHDDYINILCEIESYLADELDFKQRVDSKIKTGEINWNLSVEKLSDFGSIINIKIPLEEINETKEASGKIKIIIAEDHDVSMFGLVSMFKTKDDIEVIGKAKNGMEVLKILESQTPDIIITDISMPGMDGIELSERLQKEYPEIDVIVFTMYMENWFIDQLMNNGAKAFISKNSNINELIAAVRSVSEGKNYYCPQFKSKFGFKSNGNGTAKTLESLTKNEMQIIKLYAEDLNKNQIAKELMISDKMIDTFLANILLKLHAGDEQEIVRIAKRQKFISE